MTYDYIVIGGGSAGSVVTRRLVEDGGMRVLLLEAGGSDRHPLICIPGFANRAVASRKLNWMFEVDPDPSRLGRTDIWPAGRCLGGGSAINGMMYIRGHRQDYDRWAELGCTGWDYESILPSFRRIEDNPGGEDRYRGSGGPQSVSETREPHPLTEMWIRAVEQMGIARSTDLNGAAPDGVGHVQATQKNGWRQTAGSAFVRPLMNDGRLTVSLHSTAERIVMDGARAAAVSYRRSGKPCTAQARHGIIVCAGAMVTPKLLMLSGIGPQQHLQSHGIETRIDLPGVGENLQDHPAVMVSFNINHPTFGSRTGPVLNLWHGLNYLLRGRGPLSTSIGHAHAFIRTRPELELPNLQIITSPFAYDFDERGARLVREKAFGVAIGVMRPQPRGTVRLRSARPQDPPRLSLNMLDGATDVQALIDGVRFVRRLMNQSAISEVFRSERFPGEDVESDDALERFVREVCFSMYHQVGTCRMGVDAMAVVDPQLRVRGASGLYVADASIMPTLPSGNTNATALMIGERAAELILASPPAG